MERPIDHHRLGRWAPTTGAASGIAAAGTATPRPFLTAGTALQVGTAS